MYQSPHISAAGIAGIGGTGTVAYFGTTLSALVLLFAVLTVGIVVNTFRFRLTGQTAPEIVFPE